MASRTWRIGRRILAGVLIGLVVLVVAGYLLFRWQWDQAEDDAREDQATQAEIIRGKLERLRDVGRLEEEDIDSVVRRAQGGTLLSISDRADGLYVVAEVGGHGAPAITVPGLTYACYGFTVPTASEPVTVERLSGEDGHDRPDSCTLDPSLRD